MFIELIVVPFFILINRLRGLYPFEWVKILGLRMLFISIPLIFLFLFGLEYYVTKELYDSFLFSLSWSLIFLGWGLFGWGRWFDLGRLAENWNRKGLPPTPPKLVYLFKYIPFIKIDPDWVFELPAKLLRIPYGWAFDYISLSNRMFMLLPLITIPIYFNIFSIFILPIAAAICLIMPLCYEIAWQVRERYKKDTDIIELGEYLVGLLWGHLVLFSLIL
jgi:hypothetical protein